MIKILLITTSLLLLRTSHQQVLGAQQFHFGSLKNPIPIHQGISHPLHASKTEKRVKPVPHHLQVLKVVVEGKNGIHHTRLIQKLDGRVISDKMVHNNVSTFKEAVKTLDDHFHIKGKIVTTHHSITHPFGAVFPLGMHLFGGFGLPDRIQELRNRMQDEKRRLGHEFFSFGRREGFYGKGNPKRRKRMRKRHAFRVQANRGN